ncbi:MAG TPA: cupin domain-containing protein [Candidatus Udaeobacter sp.]|nr:cupin domain-containing protein [Candidatus Udaeobacter sp.]
MKRTYAGISELQPYLIWPGATARAVNGERLTLAVIDLEPDLPIAEHQHDNEQLGLVLKGGLTMVIGGVSQSLKPGDTYVIPSNVRHSAHTAAEGATVIDVFAPIRADWETKERLPASAGQWP